MTCAQSSPSSSSDTSCDWSVSRVPKLSCSLTLADTCCTEHSLSASDADSQDASRAAGRFPFAAPPCLRCRLPCVLSSLSSSQDPPAADLSLPLLALAPARLSLASRRPPAHTHHGSQMCAYTHITTIATEREKERERKRETERERKREREEFSYQPCPCHCQLT